MPFWPRGQAELDLLVREGRLQEVPPNRGLAQELVDQARKHLEGVTQSGLLDIDPSGAFQLTYDAARKVLTALLINQGYRARGEGGHAVLLTALQAQLEPPKWPALRAFDWMRKLRNHTEYGVKTEPPATADDVGEALPSVRELLDRAPRLLELMDPMTKAS